MYITRFAPSPTGFLHVGGARTALFNWLVTNKYGGKFILRIEDTDKQRSKKEYEEAIIDAMKTLGLEWDEFYRQSERFDIYLEHFEKLREAGWVYPCFCTEEELEAKRKAALAQKKAPRYDRTCLNLPKEEVERRLKEGQEHVWRFKMPYGEVVEWDDLVRGVIRFEAAQLEDIIVRRRDGSFTYNFSVVIDDATMGVNLVLRGDDHISNTPKQIFLYKALGYEVPKFAHVPMILGFDGKRLSKRHGAVSVQEYLKRGILPQALVNYLGLLSWSHPEGKEIFLSLQELLKDFDINRFNTSAARFDEKKLLWVNSMHLQRQEVELVTQHLKPFILDGKEDLEQLFNLNSKVIGNDIVKDLNEWTKYWRENAQTLVELSDLIKKVTINWSENEVKEKLASDEIEVAVAFAKVLEEETDFNLDIIRAAFKTTSKRTKARGKKLYHSIRIAFTGLEDGPNITEVLWLLGKETLIKRAKLLG